MTSTEKWGEGVHLVVHHTTPTMGRNGGLPLHPKLSSAMTPLSYGPVVADGEHLMGQQAIEVEWGSPGLHEGVAYREV